VPTRHASTIVQPVNRDREADAEMQRRPLRRKILGRLLALGIAALGLYVVWPRLLDVFSSWPNLREVNPAWFGVLAILEAGSFFCAWALIRLALQRRGWFRVATSQLAGNAVSRVVPGGAAAGGALQYRMLVNSGVDGAKVAAGLTAASLISTGTLFALPVLAVPAMLWGAPVAHELKRTALVGLGLFALMAAVGALLLTTDRPLTLVGGGAQRLINGVRRGRDPITDLPERLVRERDLVRAVLGSRWWLALLAAVGNWAFDFLALLAALVAVGTRPRPSLVLLAYVVAAVLGMVPITPGGLGFVEAGLATTLVLAGVSAGDAAVATLAYRLVSYWLPLPAGLVGYVFYRRSYGEPPGGQGRAETRSRLVTPPDGGS
jgi:uncharacterized protein (TIRG00374 family)